VCVCLSLFDGHHDEVHHVQEELLVSLEFCLSLCVYHYLARPLRWEVFSVMVCIYMYRERERERERHTDSEWM